MTPETDNDETPSLPRAKRGRGQPRREARGEDLLSPSEAARRLGYTPKTIGRWIKAGTLPYVLVRGMPRVRAATVEAQVMVLPQAVEQSARTLGVRSSRTGRGMGSRAGKMRAMGADLENGAKEGRKSRSSGAEPLGNGAQSVQDEHICSLVGAGYTRVAHTKRSPASASTGGEGVGEAARGAGGDTFGRPENIHIARSHYFEISPG